MEQIQSFISLINSYAWGVPMLVLILGTGLFLSVGLKFMSIVKYRGFRLGSGCYGKAGSQLKMLVKYHRSMR